MGNGQHTPVSGVAARSPHAWPGGKAVGPVSPDVLGLGFGFFPTETRSYDFLKAKPPNFSMLAKEPSIFVRN